MSCKTFLRTAYKAILIIAVFVCAVAFTRNLPVNYVNVNEYVTSDVVYADGGSASFADKNFGEVNKGDVVTLHLNLPEQPLVQNAALVFYDFNAVTEVWCGDTLLESYGEDIAARGMMIGNRDFCIILPDCAWGGEIAIILRATENHAFSNFTNLKIYPAERAYRYYFDTDPIGFVIAIALFVFGLVGLFTCALGRMYGASLMSGLYLLLSILLVSLWMIANKGIYNVFQLTYYFWQPLEYIAGYAVIIPILLFYRSMAAKTSRWSAALGIAAAAASVFFAAATVLNFTNILHYDALMGAACVLIAIGGGLMMSCSLRKERGESRKTKLLRSGTYIFVPTCLYEVLIRSIYRVFPLPFLHNLPSLISIGVLFLFMYMAAALVSNMDEMRKELESSRVKAMINQMQPHFLYNALSSIQVITKRDPDRAYTLIRDFTVHLRGSIKALSSDDPIPFEEELTNIRAYLNIEMMRFADRLHVAYDIGCKDFAVVPLTIQPLVENAVKLGVFPRGKDGGTVTIRSYETDAAFVVEVEDDGVGFDSQKKMAEDGDSYGLKNLLFRLKSLLQAEVTIKSEPGKGTLVTVMLPKKAQKGCLTDENDPGR